MGASSPVAGIFCGKSIFLSLIFKTSSFVFTISEWKGNIRCKYPVKNRKFQKQNWTFCQSWQNTRACQISELSMQWLRFKLYLTCDAYLSRKHECHMCDATRKSIVSRAAYEKAPQILSEKSDTFRIAILNCSSHEFAVERPSIDPKSPNECIKSEIPHQMPRAQRSKRRTVLQNTQLREAQSRACEAPHSLEKENR